MRRPQSGTRLTTGSVVGTGANVFLPVMTPKVISTVLVGRYARRADVRPR